MRDLTFTDHIGECKRGCGDRFRVSQETIDYYQKAEPTYTLEEIIASLDFCLECCEAEHHPREKEGLN